jgi:hypothetical protein
MPINNPIHRPINREKYVRRPRGNSRRRREKGFVIILVAVFLLFVVGAMAALSIDVVTFYTARSEAQLAADAAALAGARVLANSGVTSDPNATSDNMLANAQALAAPIATQVATSNSVGGRNLLAPEVTVSFNGSGNNPCPTTPELQVANPCVTVTVTRTDLPVFFARIWGSTQITISASATAEAFNPSGLATDLTVSVGVPIAPSCVKPWVLPNMDPTSGTTIPAQIFDPNTGAIVNPSLLGAQLLGGTTPALHAACQSNCSGPPSSTKWQYFVGSDVSFPHPTQALPSCTLNDYQKSIAGCVQTPIICGSHLASQVTILTTADATLDQQGADAVDCLTNTSGGNGDKLDPALQPPIPFEFTAGDDNPFVQAGALTSGANSMVSDSLVIVPVYDSSGALGTQVNVIGFLQLFLQPSGTAVPTSTLGIQSEIINMVGCGLNSNPTNSTVPVYGNGSSAVPVRLISHP